MWQRIWQTQSSDVIVDFVFVDFRITSSHHHIVYCNDIHNSRKERIFNSCASILLRFSNVWVHFEFSEAMAKQNAFDRKNMLTHIHSYSGWHILKMLLTPKCRNRGWLYFVSCIVLATGIGRQPIENGNDWLMFASKFDIFLFFLFRSSQIAEKKKVKILLFFVGTKCYSTKCVHAADFFFVFP